MKRAQDWDGNLHEFLADYRYQPSLTFKLDEFPPGKQFDQSVVNEIVLWKINRYASLEASAFETLNQLRELQYREHRKATQALLLLLDQSGVDLPMASTLMRFRNPEVFQIIDRHAYRAIYGDDYPLYSTSNADKKAEIYFSYIDDLIALSNSHRVPFKELDRILYVFDKQKNGALAR